MAREFDNDPHFQLGVEHGYADAPCYRWQDAEHQLQYEAGYACGRWQRITQLEELMQRRGYDRGR